MLGLSRKMGERVLIGGSIVVTVVAARGGSVRIGVEASRDVSVLREEIASCGRRVSTGAEMPGPDSRAIG